MVLEEYRMISSFHHKVPANQKELFRRGGGRGGLFFVDCLLSAGIVCAHTREKQETSLLYLGELSTSCLQNRVLKQRSQIWNMTLLLDSLPVLVSTVHIYVRPGPVPNRGFPNNVEFVVDATVLGDLSNHFLYIKALFPFPFPCPYCGLSWHYG